MVRMHESHCSMYFFRKQASLRRIVSNGGSLDKVAIEVSESAATEGVDQQLDTFNSSWHVGWTLREDVPMGAPYLTIPAFLTLGKSTAPKSRCHAILKVLRALFEEHAGSRMEAIALYVLVHFERFLEGSNSFWWPFLSSLPDVFPELPAFLPEADRALLSSMPQGGHAMAAYFNATDLILHVLADTLITRFPKAYRLSIAELEHQLRWAFTVVHSTAIENPSSADAAKCTWQRPAPSVFSAMRN